MKLWPKFLLTALLGFAALGTASAQSVTVTSPTNGATVPVGVEQTLRATVSGLTGTPSVEFFVDGIAQGAADATFPYSVAWTPAAPGPHTIEARASNGTTSASAIITVTASAGAPPVVTLVNPDANYSIALGTSVDLSANATTVSGTISSVRFLANGNIIGTADAAAPYTTVFTPTTAGTYVIAAEATNSTGLVTTSATRTITVLGGVVPSVFLLSPEADITINTASTIPLSAAASSTVATITKIEFYAGGTLIGTKTSAPYTLLWEPSTAGTYVVRAVAYDSLGNSVSTTGITVTVTGTSTARGRFFVRLLSPTDGTVLRAFQNITFAATTNVPEELVTSVDFYSNGNKFESVTALPYQTTRNPAVAGTYEFHAVLNGEGFSYSSAPVRVTVLPNDPPTVTITAPSAGTTVTAGSSVVLRASATDPDDQIDNVTFLVNGQVLGLSETFPYSITWTPTSEGVYTINAFVKDSQGSVGGNEAVSAPIYVRVVGSTLDGGVGVGTNIYAGTYFTGTETGRFSLVSVDGKKATLIARSTSGTPKTYFYSDMTVDAAGGFSLTDAAGKTIVSGMASQSGASGTFDSGRVLFIGTNLGFTPARGVVSGYYAGNLEGRLATALVGIVGADGSIMVYVRDGTFIDAADGKVDSTGSFNITSFSGNRIAGKVDSTSGFLTGTVTGVGTAPSGKFTGALTSSSTFSDGVLRGLSTRGFVGTGNNILVAGFVVNGTTPKQVLIRGLGPSMGGVSGTLADPQLQLFAGAVPVVGGSNDNWTNDASTRAAMTQVGLGLPASTLESVVIVTLAPGAYTAQLSGVGNTTGNALIELYDLDTTNAFTAQKIRALSTRGFVGTSGNELIAGFIVGGTISKKVLIQAGGPAIAGSVSGTLADPTLKVYRFTSAGAVLVRENDNWETGNDGALVTNAINSSGATPLAAGSRDAALLMDLPPGAYTAVVTGVSNTTGIAIVNAYEVP